MKVLIILLLIAITYSQIFNYTNLNLQTQTYAPYLASKARPNDKGTTFHRTVAPSSENNWVAKFSCSGCDPYNGDTSCSTSLPLLCIVNPKSIPRTYYDFLQHTTSAYEDGGYYSGWTGGIFVVTEPTIGIAIDSYQAGNMRCQQSFGPNSKYAQFHDGFYMDYMNANPAKTWNTWSWDSAVPGGWGFYGLTNTNQTGNVWIWIEGQANGNCNN